MYKKEGVHSCTIIIGTNSEIPGSNTKKSLTTYIKNTYLYPFSERPNFKILVKGNQNQIVVGRVT